MAIRNIVKYGDDRLVAPNQTVEDFDDPELKRLVGDLFETCWKAPGYGLAAPQIGVNLRVAVVDLSIGKNPDSRLVLINPRILETEGQIRDEEGCLSFPDIVEIVERPEIVAIEAFDLSGARKEYAGRDLLARAFCHEIDHLSSKLFVDRLSSLKRSFVLRRVLKRQKKGAW
ncbi:MAG: Peptide deformylase [Thermoanaerobaculia bacterium]|nr:Peptide deformylase [Thermoanaerobaculia bacterium]